MMVGLSVSEKCRKLERAKEGSAGSGGGKREGNMLVDQGNDSESFGVDLSPDFSSCNCIMRVFPSVVWMSVSGRDHLIDGLTPR